jgi:hypothetical protein
MSKISTAVYLALAVLVLAASGCQKPDATTQPANVATGFKLLKVEGTEPKDLTDRLTFVPGSLINITQSFADDKKIAYPFGYPAGVFTRTIVVRRFAPLNHAELEWRMDVKDGERLRLLAGTLVGTDLKSSRELYLPGLWRVTDANAMGTGALWLSAEVYENLSKSGLSTFDFGLLNVSLMEQVATSSGYLAESRAIRSEAQRISDRTDVRLAKVTESDIDWPLKINGVAATVKAFRVKSWFGEMVVLDSAQNPLVLKVDISELPGAPNLSKMLDYEITELRDIQE